MCELHQINITEGGEQKGPLTQNKCYPEFNIFLSLDSIFFYSNNV
jgi:hypothetical protein